MTEAKRGVDGRSPLRVLAIHRYYWPDTPPYASLLRVITQHWSSVGHAVDVLAGQPSYKPEFGVKASPPKETIDGVNVRRIAMKPDRTGPGRKVLNMVRFPLIVFVRVLFGPRYDVVMCSTAPPVVLGYLVSLASRLRGARFIYHCMDLHPEIGSLSGEFENPLVFKALRWLDSLTCRRAAAVVVLSADMQDVVIARAPHLAPSVVVINNFEIPSFETPSTESTDAPASSERLRIVFTGNVGRYQGLETITSALLADDPLLDGVELVFMGEGSAKADLIRQVGNAAPGTRDRVSFMPHASVGEARRLMATADMGLVSLMPGVISYAYPSKTATYLAEGLPILVAVEAESCLARDIRSWGVGDVLPSDTTEATRECLVKLVDRRDELAVMRSRARSVWRENFATETLLPRWDALLDGVYDKRSSA